MKLHVTKSLFISILLFIYLPGRLIFGQSATTAAMSGIVVDQNGQPLPSATVIAVHILSGTQYGTTARIDGKYNILGLRVGGPYTITVSYIGYESQKKENIRLLLGQDLTVNFELSTSAVSLSEVMITGQRNAIEQAHLKMLPRSKFNKYQPLQEHFRILQNYPPCSAVQICRLLAEITGIITYKLTVHSITIFSVWVLQVYRADKQTRIL
jgi:hypothetical protein